MRALIPAAAAACLLAATGLAQAAQTQGEVQTVNPMGHTITLWSGKTYEVAPGINLKPIKPGYVVALDFGMKGHELMADSVRIVPQTLKD